MDNTLYPTKRRGKMRRRKNKGGAIRDSSANVIGEGVKKRVR
jgi:hypothetical protein